MPTLVLALNYWLHLIATVLWLGGLGMLVLVAWPGLRPASDAQAGEFFETLERRFRPVANISLAVLIVTGMIQTGGDPHYAGLLAIGDAWSIGLFAKHIVIVGMVVVAAMLQWGVYPALDRARLLAAKPGGEEHIAAERRRLRRLAAINLGLGILVLMLTAFITALE